MSKDKTSRLASGAVFPILQKAWGCTGFDIVIGRSGLRVRELFSVINGQIKINAENNVIYADFGAKRALAA